MLVTVQKDTDHGPIQKLIHCLTLTGIQTVYSGLVSKFNWHCLIV